MGKMGALVRVGLLGLLVSTSAWAADPPAADAADDRPSAAQLKQFRSELQSVETEIVSKSVSLTTEEATRFWPVFERFQAEQGRIIDDQLAAIDNYASHYASMTDQDAIAYVQALLDRDQRVHDLREKYLREYGKVIDPGKAARVIHISRRLGLAAQAKLANAIPLVR